MDVSQCTLKQPTLVQCRKNSEAYDAWFRAKVQEALADKRPAVSHQQVMREAQALIDRNPQGLQPGKINGRCHHQVAFPFS
jgi:hypothetical protein